MPPKAKKNLSLSQKPTKAPASKKAKGARDVAQPSINTFFSSSSTQGSNNECTTQRAPLAALRSSEANNLKRSETPQASAAVHPDHSVSSQAEKRVGVDNSRSSGSGLATAGTKRSRELVQLAAQQACTSSPGPSSTARSSITPATLVKTRPTLATCPGPERPAPALRASASAASDRLERHATFGLGADSFEPSLSQECHDLLAEDDDDAAVVAFDESTRTSTTNKRSRSLHSSHSFKRDAPLETCAPSLGRRSLSLQGTKGRKQELGSRGRSVSAPVGAAGDELRKIISTLQNKVHSVEEAPEEEEEGPPVESDTAAVRSSGPASGCKPAEAQPGHAMERTEHEHTEPQGRRGVDLALLDARGADKARVQAGSCQGSSGRGLSAKLSAARARAPETIAKRGVLTAKATAGDDDGHRTVEVKDLLASLSQSASRAADAGQKEGTRSAGSLSRAPGRSTSPLSRTELGNSSPGEGGSGPGMGVEKERVELPGELDSLLSSFFLDDGASSRKDADKDMSGAMECDSKSDEAGRPCDVTGQSRESTHGPLNAVEVDPAGVQGQSAPTPRPQDSEASETAKRAEWTGNSWDDARRYRVVEVGWEQDGAGRQTQVLKLLDLGRGQEQTIVLEDDWADSEVYPGEYVVVVGSGDFKRLSPRSADPQPGSLLVVHPHTLVSATRVGDAFDCCRKGVLCERVKDLEMAEAALVGNMVHTIFQTVLVSRDWTPPAMAALVDGAVQSNAVDLWAADVSEQRAREVLVGTVPSITAWCERYLGRTPNPAAPRISFGRSRPNVSVAVSAVRDIEEMVHSSKYGIKGQIDASVEVQTADADGSAGHTLMPLELKSGREYITHQAQVMLYTFLMKERYPRHDARGLNSGLLVYLKADKMQGVPVNPMELSHIVKGRNRMARHLALGTLPPVHSDPYKCKRCFHVGVCSLYHAAVEQGTRESFAAGDAFEEHTAHLVPAHLHFFRTWEYAVSCEEADDVAKRTLQWSQPAPDREAAGQCFARMALRPGRADAQEGKMLRDFVRFDSDDEFHLRFGHRRALLTQIAITPGDRVLVRLEGGSATAGSGTVVAVTTDGVSIELRKDLEDVSGLCEAGATVLWRVDKEEFGGQFSKARRNLANLFVKREKRDEQQQLRRLIVDLESPKLSQPTADVVPADAPLNKEQRAAVNRILTASDYVLLHGMPGTGKTTTIAWAVKALVAANRRVLVAAFTHSAVDNVLVKLGLLGVGCVRLAPSEKSVHHAVRPHVLREDQIRSAADMEAKLTCARVVGTTCLNVHTASLRRQHFDVVIVDEASQVTLPHCLGPLRLGDAFALVGDHHQLPPLVTNQEARRIMGTSLFKRLSEAHPASVVSLEGQYRMNRVISGLASELVYHHRLRCGNETVATYRLPVRHPRDTDLPAVWKCGDGGVAPWVSEAVSPQNALVLVDTAEGECTEDKDGGMHNVGESVLVATIAEALCRCGLEAGQIGVITPYRAQIKAIRTQVENAGVPDVEVSTVDSYQGRDKECVILSFVRSNPDGQVGELLMDWRRVNVAVTRAKGKLVLVGCSQTLQTNETLSKMLGYARRAGTVVPIGPEAFVAGCPPWATSAMEAARKQLSKPMCL